MSDNWNFFTQTEEAWQAMYSACANATASIDFEQFIMSDDIISKTFAELFVRKIKEGVRVRLLLDAAGSYGFIRSNLFIMLLNAGVDICVFNPISAWRMVTSRIWVFRDHRKLLIIDRHSAYTGGVGFSDKFKNWRDTDVALTGEVVTFLSESFDHMWLLAHRERFLRFREPRQTTDGFTVVTNAPHFRQRFIHRLFLDAMRNARSSIFITTPYFVPDVRFFRVLILAAKRHVDVRLLVPANSNHPLVDRAAAFYFTQALKAGVKIFQYPHMIHAKTVTIDDDWSSVGSANVDNLSSFFNYEMNVACIDRKFCKQLRDHFEQDQASSSALQYARWTRRSWKEKMLEFLSAPFGRFF